MIEGVTIAGLKIYAANFIMRPYIPDDEDEITVSLNQANAVINGLDFISAKVLATQLDSWPRVSLDIPEAIINSIYEIAAQILDGNSLEEAAEAAETTSAGLGPIRVSVSASAISRASSGVVSAVAWRMLSPYLMVRSTINLHRGS